MIDLTKLSAYERNLVDRLRAHDYSDAEIYRLMNLLTDEDKAATDEEIKQLDGNQKAADRNPAQELKDGLISQKEYDKIHAQVDAQMKAKGVDKWSFMDAGPNVLDVTNYGREKREKWIRTYESAFKKYRHELPNNGDDVDQSQLKKSKFLDDTLSL